MFNAATASVLGRTKELDEGRLVGENRMKLKF